MKENKLVNDEELSNVSGGYIGFEYDYVTGTGRLGLNSDRSYVFTDYTGVRNYLDQHAGENDVTRMRGLIAAGLITKA